MIPFAANAPATLQQRLHRRLPILLNGLHNPRKLPLLIGGSAPPSNTWFLGPTSFHQNSMLIGSVVTAHRRVSHYFTMCRYVFPPKLPLPLGELCPLSNKWYLQATRVIMPNGMSIGSSVFVWVTNAILYNALSMGKKTPKTALSPWYLVTPCRRRTKPQRQATRTE